MNFLIGFMQNLRGAFPERSGQRGQVLPLLGASLVLIIGSAALAVDVGYWSNEQRLQQAAADSAAIAGAVEKPYPNGSASPAVYIAAARTDAASNGFTNDGSNTLVTVNNPPATGNYTGDSTAVEVLLKAKHNSFFSGIFGHTSDWITTRAVARLSSTNSDCIMVLKSSVPSSYSIEITGGTLNAGGCGIVDDGTYDTSGGTITANSIAVAGAINHENGTYGRATPAPSLPAADPCQAIAGCAYLANNPPGSTCTASYGGGSQTLNPGTYCGLSVSGGTVILNPGIYYIINGELKQSGGTMTGTGVTFYIGSGSDLNLTGGTTSVTAPTSGNSSGVLFYQPSSNTTTAQLTGGGGSSCPGASPVFTGLFYAPGALLDVTGGGMWNPSGIIVGALEVTGGATTCITSPLAGMPMTKAVLSE